MYSRQESDQKLYFAFEHKQVLHLGLFLKLFLSIAMIFNYARPSTIADEVFIFLSQLIKLIEKIQYIKVFGLINTLLKN